MKAAGSPVAPRSPAVSAGLVAADRAFDTRKLEPIKVCVCLLSRVHVWRAGWRETSVEA